MKCLKNIINFILSLSIYKQMESIQPGDFETDREALASDWQAIGKDFKSVIGDF
jgi:hypothetical protein